MDPLLQVGDMKTHVGWSPIYESFIFDCIYGCREVDFELNFKELFVPAADQAEA